LCIRETLKVRQLVDDTGSIFATFKPGGTTSSSAAEVDNNGNHAKPSGVQRLRTYAKFGDELIPISTEDLTALKKTANANKEFGSLTLLGFQPNNNTIPWYHMMDSAYLIYPSEDLNGNTNTRMNQEAFCHLHASMLRKGVLAMGEVLHRVHWTSRLVAIYPLQQPLDNSGNEKEDDSLPSQPPGMMVITLPFEDDMRALEPDAAMNELLAEPSTFVKGEPDLVDPAVKMEPDMIESNENTTQSKNENKGNIASEELVQATVDLIGRQRLEGMELGKAFENAALTEFFNYLESVALEVPLGEEEEDFDTRIDDATILDAARDQIEAVVKLLPEDVEVSKTTAGARKRKLVADDSGVDWEDLYRTDALADCKVPDLKKYLRSVGEPLSGNKGAIVLRVAHHLREQLEKQRNVKIAVKKEEK
jgi:hypothetical protein